MRFCVNLFAVLIATCLVLSVPWACALGPEEASVAVADADRSLRNAFRLVSDAEASGANVTGLIDRLNEAGIALTSAGLALISGNYSSTVVWAESCKALAEGISGDAAAMKNDQGAAHALTESFSIVGAAVFVAALFLVWRWFRRIHRQKLLESKPETDG